MATIASIAIGVVAKTAEFTRGMNDVVSRTRATARQIEDTFRNSLNQLGRGNIVGGLNAAIDAVEKTVDSLLQKIPLIGGLASTAFRTVANAVGIVTDAAGLLVKLFEDGADQIMHVRNSAMKLGTTLQDAQLLEEMAKAAGVAFEGMVSPLDMFRAKIGQALAGSVEMRRNFEHLGLDVKELSKKGVAESVVALGKAFSKIDNQAERAAAKRKIFGIRGAAGLGPILENAEDLHGTANNRIGRFGKGLTDADVERVFRAKQALDQIKPAATGVMQNIAVGLAPVLTGIAKKFEQWGINAQWVRDVAMKAAKGIAYGFAAVWRGVQYGIRVIDTWKMGFKVMGAATASTLTGIIEAAATTWESLQTGWKSFEATLASGLAKIMELAAKLPSVLGGDYFKNAAQGLREDANRLWADVAKGPDKNSFIRNAATGLRQETDQLWVKLKKDKKEILDKWSNQIDPFQKVEEFFKGLQQNQGGGLKLPEVPKNDPGLESRLNLLDKIQDKQRELQASIEDFGAGAGEKVANSFKRMGASENDVARVRNMADQFERMNTITKGQTATLNIFDHARASISKAAEAFRKFGIDARVFGNTVKQIGKDLQEAMASRAIEIFKSTRTPAERLAADVREANEMFRQGAMDADLYARRINQLGGRLHTDYKGVGAAAFGSQEAYAAVARQQHGGRMASPSDILKSHMQKSIELQQRANQNLAAIAQAVRRGNVVVG